MVALRFKLLIVNFSLSLTLGFNNAIAFDSSYSATIVYSQENGEQVDKKKEPRRRGDCDLLNVWTANICESNTFCYQAAEEVALWLPKHKRSGQMNDRVVIQNRSAQKTVIKQWPDSEATFIWPLSNMPLQSGSTYWVGLKKGRDYSWIELTVYQISPTISVAEQITEMRQQGCSQQADRLEKIEN